MRTRHVRLRSRTGPFDLYISISMHSAKPSPPSDLIVKRGPRSVERWQRTGVRRHTPRRPMNGTLRYSALARRICWEPQKCCDILNKIYPCTTRHSSAHLDPRPAPRVPHKAVGRHSSRYGLPLLSKYECSWSRSWLTPSRRRWSWPWVKAGKLTTSLRSTVMRR